MTVFVRVQRIGKSPTRPYGMADEHLQEVMDRAAREFFNPNATPTRPFPDHILVPKVAPVESKPKRRAA